MTRAGSTLGDLVRGLAGLRAGDDPTAARIAAMLSVADDAPARREGAAARGVGERPPRPDAAEASPARKPEEKPPRAPTDSSAPHRLSLRRVLRAPPVPAWFDEVAAMGRADPAAVPADVPPLLHPARQRALMQGLCVTHATGDDIDLDALTAQLAAGLTLERIPFRRRATLQQGVIVLLDRGTGMAPYRRDQLGMVELAGTLIADERVWVGRFDGVPGRRELFDNVRWLSKASHADAATPIIVLSDLSTGGPIGDDDRPTPAEWLAYLRLASDAGRALHVLVPRAATQWPASCLHHPALLEWSRALTLADLRRRTEVAR